MPNITARLGMWGKNYNGDGPIWYGQTGAFYNAGGSSNPGSLGVSTGASVPYLGFDASRSNGLYGDSNTVQPPTITLIPQIKF